MQMNRKKNYNMYSWVKAPETGGVFENFCVKSNLTVSKVRPYF